MALEKPASAVLRLTQAPMIDPRDQRANLVLARNCRRRGRDGLQSAAAFVFLAATARARIVATRFHASATQTRAPSAPARWARTVSQVISRSRPVMMAAVSASISRAWSWAARARASIAPLSATVACAAARGRRGYRVALHEIAERLLQPRKPGLVVTPLIDAFGIERLADLLRADGLHDAGILVEAQAPRFERQATVVKEPAQFAFRIVDEALVMHAVHAPREDGIEVLHVADVVPVVAPEFLEVVAEIDAAAEELLVAGEAAAKWMSPRVNDRGTGKHQLDEAYMAEVAQHLIDEARLARGAIYLGPRQIARCETFDLQAPERGDGLGILRRFADIGARPQLQCERGDVGQFACALHLRMGRQNLLEQRRSGAWHTHDKNWIRSLAAPF